MKIQNQAPVLAYSSVKEKKTQHDRSGNGQEGYQQEKEKKKHSPQDVLKAIEEFKEDLQSKANGLTAFLLNDVPGLKIALKDSHGKLIREMSGEDFLSLREKVVGQSGKILDKKV